MEKTIKISAEFNVKADSLIIFDSEDSYKEWAENHTKEALIDMIKAEFERSLADEVEINDFNFTIEDVTNGSN